MVMTNVIDVLPDGTITEMELAGEGMKVELKRAGTDEVFSITKVDVFSDDEEELTGTLREINTVLHEHGVRELSVSDMAGRPVAINI